MAKRQKRKRNPPSKRKTLIARFDVTALSDDEIGNLGHYVSVQSEGADDAGELDYPDVPYPDLLTVNENVPTWHRDLSAVIRDTFLEGRDQEALALMGELVNTDVTRQAIALLLANWEYSTAHYTVERLDQRIYSGLDSAQRPIEPENQRSEFYKMADRIIATMFTDDD